MGHTALSLYRYIGYMTGQAHLGEFVRRCSEGCFIIVGGIPPRISVGLLLWVQWGFHVPCR